jgi:hypothetical protein
MSDLKARRLAGEMVCLTCGGYSSAMTCYRCTQDDLDYFHAKLASALRIPKEYLSTPAFHADTNVPPNTIYMLARDNPMAVAEDYWLCKTCHSEMRGAEGCLVCDTCGSNKDGACKRCGFKACACEHLGYSDEPTIDCPLRHLAQAIFDTDPEVLAFVEQVSEFKHAKDPQAAKKRALDVAWERDERGWATRARERAAAIKGAL